MTRKRLIPISLFFIFSLCFGVVAGSIFMAEDEVGILCMSDQPLEHLNKNKLINSQYMPEGAINPPGFEVDLKQASDGRFVKYRFILNKDDAEINIDCYKVDGDFIEAMVEEPFGNMKFTYPKDIIRKSEPVYYTAENLDIENRAKMEAWLKDYETRRKYAVRTETEKTKELTKVDDRELDGPKLNPSKQGPRRTNSPQVSKEIEDQRVAICQEVVTDFAKRQQYDAEADFMCVDMACGVWNALKKKEINAILCAGNTDVENVTLANANHAWVLAEVNANMWLALEATDGRVVFGTQEPRYYKCWTFPSPKEIKQLNPLVKQRNKEVAKYSQLLVEYNKLFEQYNNTTNSEQKMVINLRGFSVRSKLEQKTRDILELDEQFYQLFSKG